MDNIDPLLLMILIAFPTLPIGILWAHFSSRRLDRKYGRNDT